MKKDAGFVISMNLWYNFADMRDMRKFVFSLNEPKREQWADYAKCWGEMHGVVISKKVSHKQN